VSISVSLPALSPASSTVTTSVDALLDAARPCTLAQCQPGSRATVIGLDDCGSDEACRLRALGLCEGTAVSVIDARHAMVLDVRGTRLALGSALTAGITVQPLPARSARR
jgi:Fe2+ transport system protein FeoA